MAVFCALTVLFLIGRDLCLASVRDVEVWLGIELHGFWARATAPLHWGIFALGAWAFWEPRDWIWPAAIGYSIYVAIGHLIWNLTSPQGGGLDAGLIQLGLFLLPTLLLIRIAPTARRRPD